ncbi:MAG: type II toxin-antitoxin system prevent-host-death family antitoxin [Spirochaetaceae bacterium]|nr:type II toxin-antitoxin system prevent-host-death family antitoxin [Spirochaetaceae bacterium]MDE0220079.1 type II toxin-antitoxin system prevent-host-death family antitoxin [Spirochaetaceae bacterium]
MADSLGEGDTETTAAPVTISEFRARLAEMVGRAERGQEVVIARGRQPVAKLVPLRMKPRRRLGLLKQLLSTEDLEALTEAVEAPLSPADQAALEGEHTDALGIARRQARSSP